MRRPEFCPRSAGIAASLTATIAIALLLSGCTSPDRSRALGDAGLSGKTIALQVCSTCHGAAGTSVSPAFPNLAGQPPAYLTAQLDAFRNRRRSDSKGHEYMWGMASSLSDAQIAELGAYYAAQPTVAGRSADAATMLAGQKVVEQGDAAKGVPACIACHGAAVSATGRTTR
jgi:cytochrome c553